MEPLTVAMGALLTDPQAATCDDGAPTLTRQVCSAQASKSAAAGDLEAAIAWCSRALELLEAEATAPGADSGAARTNADTALRLRRTEYAMQAMRFPDAVRDADDVLGGTEIEKKAFARAVRLKCRALLAMDRVDDALREWETRLSMGSRVLDELAFRREFGVAGRTPEDDDPRYDAVLQHFYRHDYGNAISLLNKAMDGAKKGKGKSKSKDPVLFLLRARCRIELKEYEGAVSDAERVLTLLPTAVEAYRWLCEALIAVNKPSQASRMCQLGLSIAPLDEALLVLNERLQTSKQEFQQRQTKKKKKEKPVGVVESEPPRLTGPRGDGEDECEPEEEEEAQEDPAFEQIRVLKRAVKTDPRNAELFARLSKVRFGLGQYEQAEKDAAHAIALDGTAVDGYVRSCEALYAARRYAKALRVCEQGLRMAESTSGGTEGLRAWESKLQDALVEPPPEEPVEYSGPVGKTRVPKAVAARKQQRAQRLVDDAHLQRTKCLEKAAELADDRDFGNAVYWLNKAEAYQSESGAARIFALRARCRFELKQYDHVAKDAERAVALDLTDAESYRWWGLSLKARGHTAKAREVCATGLAAAPDHKPLLALMRSLDAATRPSSK